MEKVHQTTTNKKEFSREAIYIIDHLCPLCELVVGALEISGATSIAKERSLVSSSERGKAKVSMSSEKPSKKKNKRTLINLSPSTTSSCKQTPIHVNFKRARYDRSDHSDDSNVGGGIGFEDFPVIDLNMFVEEGSSNQHSVSIERVETPLHEPSLAAMELPDPVVTAIILVQGTSDHLVEAMPIQNILTSLQVFFVI